MLTAILWAGFSTSSPLARWSVVFCLHLSTAFRHACNIYAFTKEHTSQGQVAVVSINTPKAMMTCARARLHGVPRESSGAPPQSLQVPTYRDYIHCVTLTGVEDL